MAWGEMVLLIEGIIIEIMAAGAFIYTTSVAKSDDIFGILLLVFPYPILMMGAAAGGFMLATAIRDWHGKTTDTLLLKLLDEPANSPARGGCLRPYGGFPAFFGTDIILPKVGDEFRNQELETWN